MNATQEATIDRLNREVQHWKRQDEHAQAYILKLQDKIAALEAEATPQAITERYFTDEQQDSSPQG